VRLLRTSLLLVALHGLASAQTLIAAGDNAISLSHLLHFHPEGMILTLPSANGQSLAEPMGQLLEQDSLYPLQLTTEDLSLSLRSGQEFQRVRGWSSDKPHWALIGPDKRIHAEGTEPPTAEALREAYRQSGLRTRAEVLREFLRSQGDHTDALARLILELRGPAERQTESRIGPAPATESKGSAGGGKGGSKGEGKVNEKDAKPQAPAEIALLSDEDDAAIWEEYASLYERLISDGHWLDAGGETGPLPIAMPLTAMAEHSPRLKSLAERLLSSVETHVRHRPSDARRWQVWLSLRNAIGKGRPGDVLAGLRPLPGARQWPPAAAIDAFVEDARATGDWRDVEPILQASYDRSQTFLNQMENAALEDAGRAGSTKVQMGTYFGFGGWTGELGLLVEAKLRLHKLQEADQLVQAVYARVSRAGTLQQAAALARTCGEDGLAEKWERMGK
jgi:hypothetical protein